MILYQIDTGCLTVHNDALPNYVAYGYSGLAECKNRSNKVSVKGRGPIPPGQYKIGPPRDSRVTGKFVMDLTPLPGTETYGRSAFEIHGDSVNNPGSASHGCVVVAMPARTRVAGARLKGDDVLTVVP